MSQKTYSPGNYGQATFGVPQWASSERIHAAVPVAAQDGPGQRAIAVRTLAVASVTRAMPGVEELTEADGYWLLVPLLDGVA